MTAFPVARSAFPRPLRRAIAAWVACDVSRRLAAAVLLAGATALTPAGAALAQSSDIQSLNQRIQRLQGELNDLQRYIYSGGGEGEEAAQLVPDAAEGTSSNQVARLHLNLQRLERDLQEMTGRLEELNHRIGETTNQLELLSQDVDLRFSDLETRMAALEQGGAAGAGAEAGAEAGAGAGAAAGGAEAPDAETGDAAGDGEGMEMVPGREPRTLGTVPQDDVAAMREGALPEGAEAQAAARAGGAGAGAAAAAEVSLPDGTPEEQYQYAFGLLRQADYAAAESALQQFLEAHPEDRLAGNAKYWLGETHYVRGDYRQAAVAFAEGYQDYPDSDKAPDNLLKLGFSLAQLDRTEDACAALDEVLTGYPNAPVNIRDRAEGERARLGC